MSRALTAEQRAAVAARTGSRLLTAAAGSGKTAVMAERFAASVRDDGVDVGAILALTFTEKAAGELRERIRARLAESVGAEEARAVDGAWIGTIHGCCARILRSQPLAAGLDPRFTVLDERGAARLATAAWRGALDAWIAAHRAPAIDLAAAYGQMLQPMVLDAHGALRSRGLASPRLAIPPAVPPPDALRAAVADAAAAAGRSLAGARDGERVRAAHAALEACVALLAQDGIPLPGRLAAAELGNGAKALTSPECAVYREAWRAYRGACADHHGRAALILLDDLLDRFAHAYASEKAGRAALDFDDLELGVRDLLAADPAARRRWAERFALIMVDEFQDTNRLQLDILEALERDNLFAVGDELQSIYGFRHADVRVFRERREALGGARVHGLTASFRAGEELLDGLNAAFDLELGDRYAPLRAGRPAANGNGVMRLFDPDPPTGAPPVELLLVDAVGWEDHDLGLPLADVQPGRRAEARAVAQRLREEVDAGRRPGDLVVLVRATASLRLFEQAIEERGLATYVVGGRGYWTQEQVRDGLAYLTALANPQDEEALLGALASPFCGVGADALVLLSGAARAARRGVWAELRAAAVGDPAAAPDGARPELRAAAAGDVAHGERPELRAAAAEAAAAARGARTETRTAAPWLAALAPAERERLVGFVRFFAAERARAERAGVEELLETALAATGYDLAILARAGGERRLANLRKLMRLGREYERDEGRDLRGFLAHVGTEDLGEAREGEAPLEAEGLDAVRLMTIHRAKGLEFPVVCVADLGRPSNPGRGRLLVGRDGRAGLRFADLEGGPLVSALGYDEIAAEQAAEEAEEERRLLYVALTRAEERLVVSGTADLAKPPAPRPGGAPLQWLGPALAGTPAAWPSATRGNVVSREWDGRIARVRVSVLSPAGAVEVVPPEALRPPPRPERPHGGRPALPEPPVPAERAPVGAARPAPRLSYSALALYARCSYRFYLERELHLPRERPPAPDGVAAAALEPVLTPLLRGSLVHDLLERLDLHDPRIPEADEVTTVAAARGVEPGPAEIEDVRSLVAAFAGSSLRRRLAAAPRVRREAPFAFVLAPGGTAAAAADSAAPLVAGVVDAIAHEHDGGILVVDYKTDRLDGLSPEELVRRDYATQRAVYALAALQGGAARVEVAHVALERPGEPATAVYDATDAAALAEQLLGLADGVLAGRHPVAPEPHRDLCGDCPGRRSLCSHPEEMTLRPPPGQDSAGTFGGSGGPS